MLTTSPRVALNSLRSSASIISSMLRVLFASGSARTHGTQAMPALPISASLRVCHSPSSSSANRKKPSAGTSEPPFSRTDVKNFWSWSKMWMLPRVRTRSAQTSEWKRSSAGSESL